jgi:hypothetical protein
MKQTITINTRARRWKLELDEETSAVTVLECAEHQRPIIERAASWAKAEASQLMQGPVSSEEYDARIAVCALCPELDAAPAPKVGWCKKCGCARNSRAELTIKGRMPAAKCPLDKWPKVASTPSPT